MNTVATKPVIKPPKPGAHSFEFEDLIPYWNAVCFLIGVTVLSRVVEGLIGYRAIGFLFLLAVLIVGFLGRLGPVLFAATLSWLTWNFFFIPPRFTFVISATEDVLMCATYFFVAIAIGVLANRVKNHEDLLREREERTNLLYEVLLDMTANQNPRDFLRKITDRISRVLQADCHVLIRTNDDAFEMPIGAKPLNFSDDDRAAAQLSLERAEPTGWSTAMRADMSALFLPIQGNMEKVGVFRFRPLKPYPLTLDQTNLLQSVCRQIGITLEQRIIAERLRTAEHLQQSEKIHQTLLNSISHELRTPLTVIIGSASALEQETSQGQESSRRLVARELRKACERLNRVVENLLDMSRLSAGGIAIRPEWHDVNDLIGVTVTRLQQAFEQRRIKVEISNELPLVNMDFRLVEHALSNLLVNSMIYAPQDSNIQITAATKGSMLSIVVDDSGPGIPAEYLPHIFDKFFRVPGSPPGGTGLGLSIVKSIAEFHEGSISAANRTGGGARFELLLPLKEAPPPPGELHA